MGGCGFGDIIRQQQERFLLLGDLTMLASMTILTDLILLVEGEEYDAKKLKNNAQKILNIFKYYDDFENQNKLSMQISFAKHAVLDYFFTKINREFAVDLMEKIAGDEDVAKEIAEQGIELMMSLYNACNEIPFSEIDYRQYRPPADLFEKAVRTISDQKTD
ncbi:MAG: hypothetical protein COV29_04320 [Candidatus Yanofskybacteria bacterium CG10_big_fil_rev_8_21_14_0_10_36_16]|uniref:Uncharacterized protein n=1 Tax=Candidatus Yanofskybacteria bacterium CG10_big_fil_rev_8_21_14_0_10_36_16 TaxID=1975096 RepID=A0A2J0Q6E4_9BACT|nr:MAG: hypothetical protein COV29_04320 [Candidatus Yanofskybacteria bacterium CG10_big_fil_rev_8_21_14_0_10_36_16]